MSAGGRDDAPPSNLIVLPGLGGATPPPEEPARDDGELAPPPPHLLEGAVEALLLASGDPLTVDELDEHLGRPGPEAVVEALQAVADRLDRRPGGGIRLEQVAKGWQLRTDARYAPWVAHMRGGRPVRLSRAAIETLAVIAYRQPVTKGQVDDLRGVDSGGVIRMLHERGLIEVLGREDLPGRPLIYGTTRRFLEMFGLRDLAELPTLRDLRELQEDAAPEASAPAPEPPPLPAGPPRRFPPVAQTTLPFDGDAPREDDHDPTD